MKQIIIDFDEYTQELQEEHFSGQMYGISAVMQWLESGKRFNDWYYDRYDSTCNVPGNWKRILRALGRESELGTCEEWNHLKVKI